MATAVAPDSLSQVKAKLEALATELEADQDPNYKDDWERGYQTSSLVTAKSVRKILQDLT